MLQKVLLLLFNFFLLSPSDAVNLFNKGHRSKQERKRPLKKPSQQKESFAQARSSSRTDECERKASRASLSLKAEGSGAGSGSVVQISSGFSVRPKRYILTAKHVVARDRRNTLRASQSSTISPTFSAYSPHTGNTIHIDTDEALCVRDASYNEVMLIPLKSYHFPHVEALQVNKLPENSYNSLVAFGFETEGRSGNKVLKKYDSQLARSSQDLRKRGVLKTTSANGAGVRPGSSGGVVLTPNRCQVYGVISAKGSGLFKDKNIFSPLRGLLSSPKKCHSI